MAFNSDFHDDGIIVWTTVCQCRCRGFPEVEVQPPMVKKKARLSFIIGQPLDYLSSWPLFALSHYVVVWLAAERAYFKTRCGLTDLDVNNEQFLSQGSKVPFKHYALLGDDIVIADEKVAEEYSLILQNLDVKIFKQKPFISKIGGMEFAKRFYVGGKALSPVSVRALLQCKTTLSLLALRVKYQLDFRVVARLSECGCKALGRLWHKRSEKLECLYTAFSRPVGADLLPLDLWIGRGFPLDPYRQGLIVDLVRRRLSPGELKPPPESLVSDEYQEVLERTLIHNWMQQWLRWPYWYHAVVLSPDPALHALFDPPVVETKYRSIVEIKTRKCLDSVLSGKSGTLWMEFHFTLK